MHEVLNMIEIYENGPQGCDSHVRVVYLSVMNRDGVLLGRTLDSMEDMLIGVRVVCADSEDLDSSEESFQRFLEELRSCDIMFINLHGDESHFKKYQRMMSIALKVGVDILYEGSLPETNAENRHLFRHPDEDYTRVRALLDLGGDTNFRSLVMWIEREIGGASTICVPSPVVARTEGLCHPDHPEDTDAEEYRSSLDPSKPTIGVMTHQTAVSRGNLNPLYNLIRSLESKGMNVIPIFCVSSPNELTGSIGSEASIRRYFMSGDSTVVDTVIMAMGFSQINMNNVDGSRTPSISSWISGCRSYRRRTSAGVSMSGERISSV